MCVLLIRYCTNDDDITYFLRSIYILLMVGFTFYLYDFCMVGDEHTKKHKGENVRCIYSVAGGLQNRP